MLFIVMAIIIIFRLKSILCLKNYLMIVIMGFSLVIRLILYSVIFWKKTVCGHNKYENNQHWVNKKDESGELYVLLS